MKGVFYVTLNLKCLKTMRNIYLRNMQMNIN